jgi:hypothetical protein
MGMCLNKKVIAVLAAVGVGVVLFAPDVAAAALPLLIVAACPLSMIFMMRVMSGKDGSSSTVEKQGQVSMTDEIAALRAEVQHLRTEKARRERSEPHRDLGGNQR